MKLRHALALIFGFCLISSASTARAAAEKAAPGTNTVAKAAAANAPIVVPSSQFAIPNSAQDGRDPFFPNSARLQVGTVKAGDPKIKAPSVALQLKGISGIGTNRVALINTTTFRAGDTETVTASNGAKVVVTCVSIGDESAVVEVLGKREELRLRQTF